MNEQELNNKLAEWAGFKLRWFNDYSWIWTDPSGNDLEPRELLPNFLQSLDACFKWLVPKVRQDAEDARGLPVDGEQTIRDLLYNWSLDVAIRKVTPALALCLAIEKLVDSET